MIKPYVFRDGSSQGEPDPPEPTYGSLVPERPPMSHFEVRCALARTRRARNPEEWAARSSESKRFLLDLDEKEQVP